MTEAFLAACAGEDMATMMALLAPDVVFVGDGGGMASSVPAPVEGAERVAGMLRSFWRVGVRQGVTVDRVEVNAEPGIWVRRGNRTDSVMVFEVADGRITAIRGVRNPHKLWGSARLRLGDRRQQPVRIGHGDGEAGVGEHDDPVHGLAEGGADPRCGGGAERQPSVLHRHADAGDLDQVVGAAARGAGDVADRSLHAEPSEGGAVGAVVGHGHPVAVLPQADQAQEGTEAPVDVELEVLGHLRSLPPAQRHHAAVSIWPQ